jgi:hypothetical protein
MTPRDLNLTYSAAQAHIFFDSEQHGRYRIFPKGRRLGATRGAAHAFIEWMLDGDACLWGDTIAGNIDRYVERYFLPTLRKASIPHRWTSQERVLRVANGFTDFRSADRPANWEGFAYKRVFLNEAGLILEDRYLYENAVLPMLLDFPDAQLIAAGTPKGRNLFHELYQRGIAKEPGFHARTFTTWENPWLTREAIEELTRDLPDEVVRQEFKGEFIDGDDGGFRIIPREWVRQAQERWKNTAPPAGKSEALGVDVARGGRDKTVIAPRWGNHIGQLITAPGTSTPDGPAVAALVIPLVGEGTRVNIDVIGVGTSPYDHLRAVHPQVTAVNGAERTDARDNSGKLGFVNVRAEAYWRLREALDPHGVTLLTLPPDLELTEDLTAPTWKLTARGVQVEAKEDIQRRLGRSPDKADAVAYALYERLEPAFLAAWS